MSRPKLIAKPRAKTTKERSSRPAAPSPPSADGRDRILAAAIQAFSTVGYDGASTAGIARAAGVAQPLVHHHFGSKEKLWEAVADAVFARIPALLPASSRPATSDALLSLVDRIVAFVADHPEATRIIAREGAIPNPRLDYLLKNYLRETFREVVDWIRASQAAGAVSSQLRPELVLFFVLGAASHIFDVSALAQQSQGIDTASSWTREHFATVMRSVLSGGLFSGNSGR